MSYFNKIFPTATLQIHKQSYDFKQLSFHAASPQKLLLFSYLQIKSHKPPYFTNPI